MQTHPLSLSQPRSQLVLHLLPTSVFWGSQSKTGSRKRGHRESPPCPDMCACSPWKQRAAQSSHGWARVQPECRDQLHPYKGRDLDPIPEPAP